MKSINLIYLFISAILISCQTSDKTKETNQTIVDSNIKSIEDKTVPLKLDSRDSILSSNLKKEYLTKIIQGNLRIEIDIPIITNITNPKLEEEINLRVKELILGKDFVSTPEDVLKGFCNGTDENNYYGTGNVYFLDSNLYSLKVNREVKYYQLNPEDSTIEIIAGDEAYTITYDFLKGREINLSDIINDTVAFKSFLIKKGDEQEEAYPGAFREMASSRKISKIEFYLFPEDLYIYMRDGQAQRGIGLSLLYSEIKKFIKDEYRRKLNIK
jgi:hypothetical protein